MWDEKSGTRSKIITFDRLKVDYSGDVGDGAWNKRKLTGDDGARTI
jgi:hypothetical protein